MSGYEKTISDINKKIEDGSVVVLGEAEFRDEISRSARINLSDIDVVTIAFHAAILGTAAMLCVPVTGPGVFTRARKIWLNGVPGHPGPAPNERLGLVDTLILGDEKSTKGEKSYDGGKLIRDVIANKKVDVECLSVEGDTYRNTFTLDQLQFARMYVYNCYLDQLDGAHNLKRPERHFKMIKVGSKILLNRAPGIVIGCGTRSRPEKKTLSMAADMFEMDPEVIKELEGEEKGALANLVALAIPVLSREVLDDLLDYFRQDNFDKTMKKATDDSENMAIYLKKLILDRKFFLIDSDMELKHWVQ